MSVVSEEALSASTETATLLAGDVGPTDQTNRDCYADENLGTSPVTVEDNNEVDAEEYEDYDHEEGEELSFWDLLFSWYLPLVLLWLRRSMFGTANLVRSLIVGQCLRLFLTQFGDLPKWAQSFADPHAWPPPAFTLLALLTLVAFVVHPDGLTWFMLGKIRDVILSILHSFASCWAMFLHDYGVITTTIALMTLAGIGCLLGILVKNALPKPSTKRVTPEKKKKKRKGLKGKGRIRQTRNKATQLGTSPGEGSEIQSKASTDDETPETEEISPISESQGNVSTSESLVEDSLLDHQDGNISTEGRLQVTSVSTGGLAADDMSCDDSVRSYASAPTAVTVGSTGNSESGRSVPTYRVKSTRRHDNSGGNNNRRKQQQQQQRSNNGRSGGSSGKRTPSTMEYSEKSSTRQQFSSPKNYSRQQNHHTQDGFRQIMPRPLSQNTGRFATLKERDTRFDGNRRINNRNSSRGRTSYHGGRGNRSNGMISYSQQSTDSFFSYPSVSSPSSSLERPYSSSVQSAHGNQNGMLSSQQLGGSPTVHYGSPYTYSPDPVAHRKKALASFVARAGLVGNDASVLIANVADIDALERLSSVQFQLYGIAPDKQARLAYMLSERRQNSSVRPPPGLSPVHDEPPTLFGSPNRPINLSPQFSSISAGQFQLLSDGRRFVSYSKSDDAESQIEAELQELGGKMVEGILDF